MFEKLNFAAATLSGRKLLGGRLLAPFAGAATAAGWTPGFGRHQVGSSSMMASAPGDRPMEEYLIGRPQPQGAVYLDQVISDRKATLVIDVKVPKDWPGVWPGTAGRWCSRCFTRRRSPTPAPNTPSRKSMAGTAFRICSGPAALGRMLLNLQDRPT